MAPSGDDAQQAIGLLDQVLAYSAVVVVRVDPPGTGRRARWYRLAL